VTRIHVMAKKKASRTSTVSAPRDSFYLRVTTNPSHTMCQTALGRHKSACRNRQKVATIAVFLPDMNHGTTLGAPFLPVFEATRFSRFLARLATQLDAFHPLGIRLLHGALRVDSCYGVACLAADRAALSMWLRIHWLWLVMHDVARYLRLHRFLFHLFVLPDCSLDDSYGRAALRCRQRSRTERNGIPSSRSYRSARTNQNASPPVL